MADGWWYFWHGYIAPSAAIFSLLPALILFLYNRYTQKLNRPVFTTERATGSFLTSLAIFIALLTTTVGWLTCPATNPASYRLIMATNRHRHKGLIADFPRSIPENATNVRFYYRPSFLMGSNIIQLHFKTTPSEAKAILKEYAKSGKHFDDVARIPLNGFLDEPNRLLPSDFRLIILQAHPDDRDGEWWNHGFGRGVAVSMKRNEVIYWGESW